MYIYICNYIVYVILSDDNNVQKNFKHYRMDSTFKRCTLFDSSYRKKGLTLNGLLNGLVYKHLLSLKNILSC